jgi:hypothetical protein
MNKKYIYYGWVDNIEYKYGVYKYPIIEEKTIIGIHSYVVDQYLVTGQYQSTRYIEDPHLDRILNVRDGVSGMMSLDHNKVLEWVKEEKMKKETELLNAVEKIQCTKIDNCGEAMYI